MNDAEIIKDLEERIKELKEDYKRLQLLDAPMDCFEESHIDNIRILSNILDLINRQKAEIERLTINMNAFGLGMKREKERADTAREEAMKEFAERFLSIAQRVDRDDVDELILIKRDLLDSFVKKEMAGDT